VVGQFDFGRLVAGVQDVVGLLQREVVVPVHTMYIGDFTDCNFAN
jgi:hypothetical protein